MEKKQPPEKAGSFSGQNGDKSENGASDNTDNAAALLDDPELETVESKSDDQNIKEHEKTTENAEGKPPSPPHSNLDNALPQVSEEIGRFISNIPPEVNNPEPEVPDCVERFTSMVESMIVNYERGESSSKFGNSPEEDTTFLQALSRLAKLTNALAQIPFTPSLSRTGTVLHRAMSFLEEELRILLDDFKPNDSNPNSDPKGPKPKQPSFKSEPQGPEHCTSQEGEFIEQFPAHSPEPVSTVSRIAASMIDAGYETECCHVYIAARRQALKEGLKMSGCENLSIDEIVKMNWEPLEGEIATWIEVVKQCGSVLLPGEHEFCEAVFSEYPSLSRCLFGDLAHAVLRVLLNFAEAVALTKRAAEKLFKFLDMYEALNDLVPVIDKTCSSDLTREMKTQISSSASRLGESVVCIFCELENSIKSDTGRVPVPSGAVHPLTRYVMNYLKYATDYRDTMEEVFDQHMKVEQSNEAVESGSGSEKSQHSNHQRSQQPLKQSLFSTSLTTVMELLDSNLEAKSKLYRDPSLRYIFLMNNGRYILQKIKGSPDLNQIIGDRPCRKRSSDLRQYHKNYQRETWGKVLGCLTHEGLQVNGKVYKPVLKERFKNFNATFDEIHKVQSTWVVSDEQLQTELRVSVSSVIIPAYRAFLGRFSQYLDSGRQTEKYVKYQPEDIENLVEELFDGNPTSMARRRT